MKKSPEEIEKETEETVKDVKSDPNQKKEIEELKKTIEELKRAGMNDEEKLKSQMAAFEEEKKKFKKEQLKVLALKLMKGDKVNLPDIWVEHIAVDDNSDEHTIESQVNGLKSKLDKFKEEIINELQSGSPAYSGGTVTGKNMGERFGKEEAVKINPKENPYFS